MLTPIISIQRTLSHLILFAISHQQSLSVCGSAPVCERDEDPLKAERGGKTSDRFQPITPDYSIITLKYISVNRIKNCTQLQYKSAIAFQLAKDDPQLSLEIAKQILRGMPPSVVTEIPQITTSLVLHDLDYAVIPPGWIYITLSHRGVADWVQGLLQIPLRDRLDPLIRCSAESCSLSQSQRFSTQKKPLERRGASPGASSEFQLQYTHARCCSLLYFNISADSSVKPESDANSREIQRRLAEYVSFDTFLSHETTWSLLELIVDSLDQIVLGKVQEDPKLGRKLACQLSLSFLNFERWATVQAGEGRTRAVEAGMPPDHLALIWITQQILQALLETGCGLVAPKHL